MGGCFLHGGHQHQGNLQHEAASGTGITQKSAWHMLQGIRKVFRNGEVTLSDIVEIDEAHRWGQERKGGRDGCGRSEGTRGQGG